MGLSVLCGSFISHPICVLLGAWNILFVSFVAGGVPGRVFLKFDERVSLDVIENTISGLYSGERVLVTGYKTVSRYEYELNIKS